MSHTQVCTPESKEECTTTYEEKCKVTYAKGKECEQIPHKHCKYVQVKTTIIKMLLKKGKLFFVRFHDVRNLPTRSARKVMRISARKHQRRLERKLPSTDAPGLREAFMMTQGAELGRFCLFLLLGILFVID